ncbi:hypothetical protein DV737_g5410, partial [Chaetothyriales sp. CBS 132003]
MASGADRGFKQDLVVSIRYRNDLPPPPMPPKLLDIDTGGIQQYLTTSYASSLARREMPNIDADAEGGMPIDMVGRAALTGAAASAAVDREDKENIKRHVQKGFDIAYPESIPYNPPETRSHAASQQEREAWRNPKHPTNRQATAVCYYPIVPDLDTGTDLSGWCRFKFEKPPLAPNRAGRDSRIDVGSFFTVPDKAVEQAWLAKNEAWKKEPEAYDDPGPQPHKFSLHIPRRAEDTNTDSQRFMALGLYDKLSASTRANQSKQAQGAAAYYYPINENVRLRADRKLADFGSEEAEDLADVIYVAPTEPTAQQTYNRHDFRGRYDRLFAGDFKRMADAVEEEEKRELEALERERGELLAEPDAMEGVQAGEGSSRAGGQEAAEAGVSAAADSRAPAQQKDADPSIAAATSPSSSALPPLLSPPASRFGPRRPTPPASSQAHSPIHILQSGASQQSGSFSGRSITSPRSRTRSPSISSNPSSATGTQSSTSKISATQVLLLLDTITTKTGQAEWQSKAAKILKLVDSNGMEVFTQFFRRVVASNAQTIFSGTPSSEQGAYKLLLQEMDKIAKDADQASKIAEAIDTSRDDVFRDFDLSTFITHFHLDQLAQTLLAIAFTRCVRVDLRNKADKFLATTLPLAVQALADGRATVQDVHARNMAAFIEYLAFTPILASAAKRFDFFWMMHAQYSSRGLEVAPEVVSALMLLRLPSTNQRLVKALIRAGGKSTASRQAVEDVLHAIGLNNIDDLELAHAMLFMLFARSQAYDLTTFINTAKAKTHHMRVDWPGVLSELQLPGIRVQEDDFLRLFTALHQVAVEDASCDLQKLWAGTWQDPQSQLSFLHAFLMAPPAHVGPKQIPAFRPALAAADLDSLSPELQQVLQEQLNSPFASADALRALFDVLLALDGPGDEAEKDGLLRELFEHHCELFLLALHTLKPKPWTSAQEQFVHTCFRPFLNKQRPSSSLVLPALFAQSPQFLFDLCAITFQQDPTQTEDIYARAIEFDWMDEFLKHWSNPLALDMACMRSKLDPDFDLDRYLSDIADGHAAQLGVILCKYVRIKADDEYRVQKELIEPQSVPLTLSSVHTLLDKLEELTSDRELVESAQTTCLQTYPRLMNFGAGFDHILERSSEEKGNKLPDTIDAQMSELFGRMYRSELTIRDMVREMSTLKTSQDPDQQDLFCCIVHGLFDEYGCYSEYPEDALLKTALLFGSMIKFKLLPDVPKNYGLVLIYRAVRDNLPDTLMYRFGIEALLQISEQLPEWPGLAAAATNGGGDAGDAGAPPDTLPNAFKSIRADPPPGLVRFRAPDQQTQEKVLFVINNLSKDNMSAKFPEVKSALATENLQWFAAYLVEQRAKLEPNNQDMYLEFALMMEDDFLVSELVRETFVSVVKLINADATLTSSQSTERNQLKSLGSWLGALTLAQDKPIKHRNICFVDFLIEGLETQRLLIVIPFTCKVLAQSAKSVIFKHHNPWLMEIAEVLKELYDSFDLKLSLKFEIEVLFNDHLKLNLKKLPISHIRLSVTEIMARLPPLVDHLKYPPPSGNPNEQALVRETVYRAFDQAIQEIIAPVVERSITIASIATQQLISKDYALERHADHLRTAAREMVKSLAGSLALVTCKEPLKSSITTWMRRPLDETQDPIMPEGAISMCVNDNIDTACSFVEQAAITHAEEEIDNVIKSEIDERNKFVADANTADFISSSSHLNRWSTWIPEPYKQTVGGLNEAQRAVYEEFGLRVRGMNIGHAQNVSTDSTGRQIPDVLQDALAMPNLSTPADSHVIPHQSPMVPQDPRLLSAATHGGRINGMADNIPAQERIAVLIEDVQKASRVSEAKRLKDVEKNSPIFQDFRQILIILTSSARPASDLLARQVAEKICTIFVSKPPHDSLEAEWLAFLLSKVCQLSELIIRDVLRWMTANEHLLLANSNVIAALVIVGLMDFSRVDTAIAATLGARDPQGLQLLSDLLDQTLFNDEPQAMRADFANSLVEMSRWLAESPDLEPAREINQKLKARGMPDMFENLNPDANATAAFLKDMHRNQAINGTDDLANFLKLALETCIEAFEREASTIPGSLDVAFLPTDALARLIIMLVVYQGETNGAVRMMHKAPYLDTILSVLVLIANHHQVMHGIAFHQRVFHRLVQSIIYAYQESGLQLTPEHNDFILAFAKLLNSLQPAWFPGFAFSWLALITQRVLVPGLLDPTNVLGAKVYRDLLALSFDFLGHTATLPNVEQVVADMHRGVIRNLLVLHHDYPEFICTNYTYLCSRVPFFMPQLRNLILTSRPAAYQDLPDPMTPGLKVDRLEEMKKSPRLADDFDAPLREYDLIDSVDAAIRKGGDPEAAAIKTITATLEAAKPATVTAPAGSVQILNALVPYVGVQAIVTAAGASFDPNSSHASFLVNLTIGLGFEHRYYLLNALFDQIRYPNTHTDFFCKFILNLWVKSIEYRDLREQICRLVYERLAVARPHPWGLTILTQELLSSSTYGFWELVSSGKDETQQALFHRLQQAMRQGFGQ